jgi:hypothetical protein
MSPRAPYLPANLIIFSATRAAKVHHGISTGLSVRASISVRPSLLRTVMREGMHFLWIRPEG